MNLITAVVTHEQNMFQKKTKLIYNMYFNYFLNFQEVFFLKFSDFLIV